MTSTWRQNSLAGKVSAFVEAIGVDTTGLVCWPNDVATRKKIFNGAARNNNQMMIGGFFILGLDGWKISLHFAIGGGIFQQRDTLHYCRVSALGRHASLPSRLYRPKKAGMASFRAMPACGGLFIGSLTRL